MAVALPVLYRIKCIFVESSFICIYIMYETGREISMESRTDEQIESGIRHTPPRGQIRRGCAVVNVVTSEIGVVGNIADGCVAVAVRRTVDGKLCDEEVVMHLGDCRPASLEEKRALQRLLNGRGLLWDMRHRRLKRNGYVPREGARVQLSTLGEEVVIGVFKEIDAGGRIVMYCMMRPGERPAYSTHEVAGAAADFQMQPVGSTARMKLDRALAAEGVVWNGHLRSVEVAGKRLSREQVYYYLNEFFEVREVRDAYKPRDRKRLAAGNYFATREAAESMRACFVSILRMRHGAETEGRGSGKGDIDGGKKR